MTTSAANSPAAVPARTVAIFVFLLLLAASSHAANFKERGFVDANLRGFPQLTPNDRAHFVGDLLVEWEPSISFGHGVTLLLGVDARTDSHQQVARDLNFSWWDRTAQRQPIAARRFSLVYRHRFMTLELGKQFIRWGKTDILNPTDRFAPKDYLTVTDAETLPVTAARMTLDHGDNSVDFVYVPRFTPSRIPLLDQRWTVLPPQFSNLSLRDAGAQYPGGPQFGVRWNRVASRLEYSFSFYQGYNTLPLLSAVYDPVRQDVNVRRSYPNLRSFGGATAVPLRWLTLKAEAASLTSSTPGEDNYVLFVVQGERQWKEWLFIGGYTGDAVTTHRGGLQFAADRGLARAVFGRASVNLAGDRSLTFEALARQNGNGFYGKASYSQPIGQHWRLSLMFIGIRGDPTDFLGQYRRNSYAVVGMRYSF